MTGFQIVGLALNASMFLIVMAVGMRATLPETTYLLRRPGLLVRSLIAMNVVMVAMALAIIVVLRPAQEVRVALVALALAPVPPLLPVRQVRAGGSGSYAVGLLCATAAASIVMVPLGLMILSELFDTPLRLSAGEDAGIVMLSVVLPLAIGIAIRHAAPDLAEQTARPATLAGALLLVIALIPVVVIAWPSLIELFDDGMFSGLVAFSIIGLAIGHVLGGPGSGDRTVLALATSARHPGVAMAIATLNFPELRGVLAVIVFHLIISFVVVIPYLRRMGRGYGDLHSTVK